MILKIEGLDKLLGKLDTIQKEQCIQRALTKSCLIVEAQAKVNCPVDDGQLRQSIGSEVKGNIGAIGTNVEYAPYVHQGTGIYAVNGDGRKTRWKFQDAKGEWHSTIGQPPNPFLERALDANREQIIDTFKEEITFQKMIGALIIIAGVYLVVSEKEE